MTWQGNHWLTITSKTRMELKNRTTTIRDCKDSKKQQTIRDCKDSKKQQLIEHKYINTTDWRKTNKQTCKIKIFQHKSKYSEPLRRRLQWPNKLKPPIHHVRHNKARTISFLIKTQDKQTGLRALPNQGATNIDKDSNVQQNRSQHRRIKKPEIKSTRGWAIGNL